VPGQAGPPAAGREPGEDGQKAAQTAGFGVHHLKSWPEFFKLVWDRCKPYEIRKDDRQFRIGDKIILYEWDGRKSAIREADVYTGREARGVITSITRAADCVPPGALGEGYAVLGIEWDARAEYVETRRFRAQCREVAGKSAP